MVGTDATAVNDPQDDDGAYEALRSTFSSYAAMRERCGEGGFETARTDANEAREATHERIDV